MKPAGDTYADEPADAGEQKAFPEELSEDGAWWRRWL